MSTNRAGGSQRSCPGAASRRDFTGIHAERWSRLAPEEKAPPPEGARFEGRCRLPERGSLPGVQGPRPTRPTSGAPLRDGHSSRLAAPDVLGAALLAEVSAPAIRPDRDPAAAAVQPRHHGHGDSLTVAAGGGARDRASSSLGASGYAAREPPGCATRTACSRRRARRREGIDRPSRGRAAGSRRFDRPDRTRGVRDDGGESSARVVPLDL